MTDHAQVIREALLDFSTELVPGEITPRCAEALAALAALVSDLEAAREALREMWQHFVLERHIEGVVDRAEAALAADGGER